MLKHANICYILAYYDVNTALGRFTEGHAQAASLRQQWVWYVPRCGCSGNSGPSVPLTAAYISARCKYSLGAHRRGGWVGLCPTCARGARALCFHVRCPVPRPVCYSLSCSRGFFPAAHAVQWLLLSGSAAPATAPGTEKERCFY